MDDVSSPSTAQHSTVPSTASGTGQTTPSHSRKVAIIGGGPVGTLAGLYFSKSGWDVEIYELRPGWLHTQLLLGIIS